VQDFAVKDTAGTALAWTKINKNTWAVDSKGVKEIVATYRVYANELTVRTNELNDEHAFWNNGALLMFVKGPLKVATTVKVNPAKNWRVATGLPPFHGPTVVPGEDGLHRERQVTQERLLRRNPPVVFHVDERAVLSQCPTAGAVKIACRPDGETIWRRRLRHHAPTSPARRVHLRHRSAPSCSRCRRTWIRRTVTASHSLVSARVSLSGG